MVDVTHLFLFACLCWQLLTAVSHVARLLAPLLISLRAQKLDIALTTPFSTQVERRFPI